MSDTDPLIRREYKRSNEPPYRREPKAQLSPDEMMNWLDHRFGGGKGGGKSGGGKRKRR